MSDCWLLPDFIPSEHSGPNDWLIKVYKAHYFLRYVKTNSAQIQVMILTLLLLFYVHTATSCQVEKVLNTLTAIFSSLHQGMCAITIFKNASSFISSGMYRLTKRFKQDSHLLSTENSIKAPSSRGKLQGRH